MCSIQKRKNLSGPLLCLALLLLCSKVYTQNLSETDTLIKISPGTFIQIADSISYFSNDTILILPSSVKPLLIREKETNSLFLDSLKLKASKNTLTRKLYDFVIITPATTDKKRITDNSEENFISSSGKKIRKIDIQRLKVFGSSISNPANLEIKKIDNILNKTHINTNEKIIRKNLLFSVGDTISPLLLSDNERILRQLSYINDARIIVVPVSDEEVDLIVLTKDVYSIGADYSYKGLKKGSVSIFDKNIFGIGHELGLAIPYDSELPDSPGLGFNYIADNIGKSFLNLNLFYLKGLGDKTYGFDLSRKLISSTTLYAGGISVKQRYTTVDLDTLIVPEPLKYNLQDYWLSRSFLINKESVTRIIVGARYKNNNVFEKPDIASQTYYNLQKYRIFLGSAAFSVQKYYKTNLIYSYGRTEDIPYGGLFKVTVGKEINEFKKRSYLATEISIGKSNKDLGYFYSSAGIATFLNKSQPEQGIISLRINYFSNLLNVGNTMIRNFIYVDYTKGFDRYIDERLVFQRENGLSGLKNDSVSGSKRLSISLESVIFSPVNLYGFRFALFGFSDFSFISDSQEIIGYGNNIAGIGIGIRIRNDNLVFKTFQVRIGFFPNPPLYSLINNFSISGEQILRPNNFDSGPPSIIPYR